MADQRFEELLGLIFTFPKHNLGEEGDSLFFSLVIRYQLLKKFGNRPADDSYLLHGRLGARRHTVGDPYVFRYYFVFLKIQ